MNIPCRDHRHTSPAQVFYQHLADFYRRLYTKGIQLSHRVKQQLFGDIPFCPHRAERKMPAADPYRRGQHTARSSHLCFGILCPAGAVVAGHTDKLSAIHRHPKRASNRADDTGQFFDRFTHPAHLFSNRTVSCPPSVPANASALMVTDSISPGSSLGRIPL